MSFVTSSFNFMIKLAVNFIKLSITNLGLLDSGIQLIYFTKDLDFLLEIS